MKKQFISPKHILLLVMFVSLMGCQHEAFDKGDNGGGGITIQSINAWEPPFSLMPSDSPPDVVTKLQAAIASAQSSNKKLIIERGVYTINAPITFPSNIEIDFSGAEFVRESGKGVDDIFTMFTNADHVNGNSNITLSNLKINGNKNVDALRAENYAERFSGLEFNKVSASKLYKITATQTVNAETGCGIFFTNESHDIDAYELTAYDNDRSGILINHSNAIRIHGAVVYNNDGSGIASEAAPRCEYYNIVAYHNGFYDGHVFGCSSGSDCYHYSNVSVNGIGSKIDGVLTYDCSGSGLVVGHPYNAANDGEDMHVNSSDYTIVDNVESYDAELDGITVSNSKSVLMSNLHVYNNFRCNIQIYDNSSEVQITNADVHGYYTKNDHINLSLAPSGLQIIGGDGHNLNNVNVHESLGHGIYINGTTGPISLGSEVNSYNNGQLNAYRQPNNHDLWVSGIFAENAKNVYITGSKSFSNQPSGSITQKYGIVLWKVQHVRIYYPQCYGNGLANGVMQIDPSLDTDVSVVY
ncbi:MAG TPA: right-handed parallel beta-helix repeat-containing protein [Chryseolinea sp.]